MKSLKSQRYSLGPVARRMAWRGGVWQGILALVMLGFALTGQVSAQESDDQPVLEKGARENHQKSSKLGAGGVQPGGGGDAAKGLRSVPPAKRALELRQWQKKMSGAGDLALNWEQKQYKALRKNWVMTSGKGYFSPPQHFHWQISTLGQAWVFDGQRLTHVDHEQGKGLAYPVTGHKGKEFMRFIGLITQFDDLTREYRIKEMKSGPGSLDLTLEPYQNHELTGVEVSYLKKDRVIQKIKMNFVGGNHTSVVFSGHKRGKLPKSTFAVTKKIKVETAS